MRVSLAASQDGQRHQRGSARWQGKSHEETGSQRPETLQSYSMCCVVLGRLIWVVQIDVCVCLQESCMLTSSSLTYPQYFFRRGFSLNLESIILPILGGLQAPGISLSQSPRDNYAVTDHFAQPFIWLLVIQAQLFMLTQ